jgi:hypothetical protein
MHQRCMPLPRHHDSGQLEPRFVDLSPRISRNAMDGVMRRLSITGCASALRVRRWANRRCGVGIRHGAYSAVAHPETCKILPIFAKIDLI